MITKINATVLFVDDLDKCVAFYRDIIGFKVSFNDDVSFGFVTKDQDFLLLQIEAAVEMVGEEALARGQGAGAGKRVLFCAGVDNVDDEYNALMAKGLKFIKPPVDKPWGRRTAYFADPEGNLWELFHMLDEQK